MLTATKQATTGYWIDSLKKNIYSIEELNYFIYHHIEQVYRDFFSDALFDYIEKDLEQPLMASDLRDIARKGGGASDFVKYILNESYYYNTQELAEIATLVAGLDRLTRAERLKIQGDSCCKEGNLNSALKCYLEILRNMGQDAVSDQFYGRVAYAVGTIYAMQFMGKSANAFFSYAYDLYPDPLYAKACVYMSLLSEDDEELLAAIVKYKLSDDSLDSLRSRVIATRHELETSDELRRLDENLTVPGFAEQLLESWKQMYYKMLE